MSPSLPLLVLTLLSTSLSFATVIKPALILVPGAFHRASVYDEVQQQLSSAGYLHIDSIDLPSVGYSAGGVERTADVRAVTAVLEHRLENGEDVVLVGNSYGATVIGEAVKECEAYSSGVSTGPMQAGKGRILGLIMVPLSNLSLDPPLGPANTAKPHQLAGYIPTISEVQRTPPRPDIRSIGAPFFAYHPRSPNPHDTTTITTNTSTSTTPSLVTWDLNLALYPPHLTFYNLLPPARATHWTAQLLPSSFAALNATGTYIPYAGAFRTLYVIGESDNCVTPAFARMQYVEQEGARFEVEVVKGDHVPMLSAAGEVAGVVRRFVGEGGGREREL